MATQRPLVSGDTTLSRITNQAIMLLGDSIIVNVASAFPLAWPVNWTGIAGCGSGTPIASESIGTPAPIKSAAVTYTGSTTGALAKADYSPFDPYEVKLDGTTSGNSAGVWFTVNRLTNFYALGAGSRAAAWWCGDWLNGQTVAVDTVFYQNSAGSAGPIIVKAHNGTNGGWIATPSAEFSCNASSPAYLKKTLSASWTAAACEWGPYIKDTTATVNDSNILVAGTAIASSVVGWKFGLLGHGGWQSQDYSGTARQGVSNQTNDPWIAQTAWQVPSLLGYSHYFVMLGANGRGVTTTANHLAYLRDMIARIRSQDANATFTLVSQYHLSADATDEAANGLGEYADAMYTIANDTAGVQFLNGYAYFGSYGFLDAKYLTDHVHPTAAGDNYFAAGMWALRCMAEIDSYKTSIVKPATIGTTTTATAGTYYPPNTDGNGTPDASAVLNTARFGANNATVGTFNDSADDAAAVTAAKQVTYSTGRVARRK